MKKFISILILMALSLSGMSDAAESGKVKLSPGMVVRLWPGVSLQQKEINTPAPVGFVDLGADFGGSSLVENQEALELINTSRRVGLEYAGYMRIEKGGEYVITVHHTGFRDNVLYVYIRGIELMTLKMSDKPVSTATLKLTPGYYPVKFFAVAHRGEIFGFTVKVHPASELSAKPMRISDFFHRKK